MNCIICKRNQYIYISPITVINVNNSCIGTIEKTWKGKLEFGSTISPAARINIIIKKPMTINVKAKRLIRHYTKINCGLFVKHSVVKLIPLANIFSCSILKYISMPVPKNTNIITIPINKETPPFD